MKIPGESILDSISSCVADEHVFEDDRRGNMLSFFLWIDVIVRQHWLSGDGWKLGDWFLLDWTIGVSDLLGQLIDSRHSQLIDCTLVEDDGEF